MKAEIRAFFYLAIVIGAYRRAIDAYYEGRYDDAEKEQCLIELSKASHRGVYNWILLWKKADEDAQKLQVIFICQRIFLCRYD